MDEAGTATVAAPASNPASSGAAAAPPPPAARPANGSTDRTTQAAPYREVVDRLGKGESPHTIRQDWQTRQPAAPANGKTPPAGKSAPAQPNSPANTPAQDHSKPDGAAAPAEENYGLSEKELNAIKRHGGSDVTYLALMPLTNRKAIAKRAGEAIAEADRTFQSQRQATAAGENQAKPTDSQEATPGKTDGTATPAEPGKPAAQQAAPEPSLFAPFKISEARSQTLHELGGKAAVESLTGLAQEIDAHVSGQLGQVMKLVNFTLERFERTDFADALDALKKQPGLENLTEDQVKQLRDEARTLIVAKGDPMSYGWKNAVPIAAAGLFQQNVQQAAQAALLQSRTNSLQAAPDKGDQRVAQPGRPMNQAQRTKAIGQYMIDHPGVQPGDAARAVDAAT